MTDINKLEKLAKLVEAGPWIATPNGPLWIKRDGDGYQRGWRESRANDTAYLNAANPAAILSLISQYRRMEEALKRIENESNQWEPSIYDMGMWACEALKGNGPAQDISALQDQDQ